MVEQPANDPGLESAVAAAVGAVDAGEVVRIARALIAAPSENPGGTEEEAAQVAAEVLAGLDAEPRIIRSDEDRPSVLAAVGSAARPSLAWNGHLDVVPAGAVETWPHPPWDDRSRPRSPPVQRSRGQGLSSGAPSTTTWQRTRRWVASTARR
jgi:hypothetical protein